MSITRNQNKGKPTWTVRIDLPPYADGRRRQKSKTFKTRKDAEDYLTKTRHELRQGIYIEPSTMPLSELLAHWFQTNRERPNSKVTYASVIQNHLLPAFGETPISQLTPSAIQAYYNEVQDRLERPEVVHRILNSALKQAVREQLLPRNPCEGLQRPRYRPPEDPEEQQVRVWTAAELVRLLATLRGGRDGALAWVGAHTGLRPGELLALPWREVDLDAGTIRVAWTLTRDDNLKPTIGPPKTRASRRVVGIDPTTIRVLREHRARQHEQRLALGKLWQDQGLVFPRPNGERDTGTAWHGRFKRACARAGVEVLTPHCLRHTHASLLLAAGRPLHYVSRRLGHASIDMTVNIYGHLIPGSEWDDAQVFAQVIAAAQAALTERA